jgi:hypothetical protein
LVIEENNRTRIRLPRKRDGLRGGGRFKYPNILADSSMPTVADCDQETRADRKIELGMTFALS